MERYEWIATAAFGLEGVVARELARLGIDAKAENGGARFFGTFASYAGKQLFIATNFRDTLANGCCFAHNVGCELLFQLTVSDGTIVVGSEEVLICILIGSDFQHRE